MTTYRTFKRSATNWTQFAAKRKTTIDRGLTYDEAKRACKNFNDNRTPSQRRKGTMLEFTAEGGNQ
jgi:hypothetical protein